MKVFNSIISAIYPNKCIGCGEIITEDEYLCKECAKAIERNSFDDFCVICGHEKKHCVCNLNVYRFERLISVFKNYGIAQKAYYTYKFNKKRHYVKFFAQEMTDALTLFYKDVQFDFVCSVPPNMDFFKNSHFDHSGFLRDAISEETKIPVYRDLLICRRHKKQQHKLSLKKRLTNVEGKFICYHRIDGATVLLVDDIRTTGATLDECAKILLYAGADRVYCVTALGTVMGTQKEN